MNHPAVPYDDIFPTQVHESRTVSQDQLLHGFREDGLFFFPTDRALASGFWVYLRPFI